MGPMKNFIKGQKESNRGHKQVFCHIKELQCLNKAEKKHTFGKYLAQEIEKPVEVSALYLQRNNKKTSSLWKQKINWKKQ